MTKGQIICYVTLKEESFARFTVKVTRFGFNHSPQALRSTVSPVTEEPEGLSARLCGEFKETTDLFFSSSGTAGVPVQSARSLM